MEYVRKSDVERIGALTNKGFDPNFVDRTSGGLTRRIDHLVVTARDRSEFELE